MLNENHISSQLRIVNWKRRETVGRMIGALGWFRKLVKYVASDSGGADLHVPVWPLITKNVCIWEA